jgi:hypothetical protein|tara:strand:- start:169 stop:1038 length:870 start_codon:yes stop_codon:yes gene_type:complete
MSEEEVVESTEEVVETPVEETTEQDAGSVAFVDSMLEQIDDEDVKGAGFWKNLQGKNANEVGQYIKELQSFAGKKGDIPKSDASEDEWNDFYSKLGRPENVEGYDFSINQDFADIVGQDAASAYATAIEEFKKEIFKIGANADQAEGLVDWYLERAANTTLQTKEAFETAEKEKTDELKKAWGESYDGMNKSIEGLLRNNGMEDEHIEWAKQSGILNEPTLAITLGNIANRFADDPEIGHLQTKTQAGIRDQLAEVNIDVTEYLKKGQPIPPHIAQKRQDLMDKLGDDL